MVRLEGGSSGHPHPQEALRFGLVRRRPPTPCTFGHRWVELISVACLLAEYWARYATTRP